ncbi:MAG: V-type ATPase subunit [Synergistaceae bacterium]|jgi:V/A-type H+-transporting ATPase subunit C|nr:V-type ATPase subunit [Synergistaceae bacterium]
MACSGGRIAESSKARARRGTLLQDEDYRVLLEQRSVGDIAVELKKTSYSSVLQNFSLETMHRTELEFLLFAAILEEGLAFRWYMRSEDREILELWFQCFDIELFRNHFHFQMKTEEWEQSDVAELFRLSPSFRLTLIDREKLFASTTPADLLAAIKKETLRLALEEILPAGGGTGDQVEEGLAFQRMEFSGGMILDRYYFSTLYAASRKLAGVEGRMMQLLTGTRVDLMNLYWIYRSRRFFNMRPEEALTLIMKARYRADFDLLTKAAFAEPGAFASVLKETRYGQVFDAGGREGAMREVQIEKNICRFLLEMANRVFLSGSLGFQNVAAYLMLKEFEVRDLITIIEAVRYGFERKGMDALLIHRLSDEASYAPAGKEVN